MVVRSDVADPSTAATGRQQQTTDGRFIVSIIINITIVIIIIIDNISAVSSVVSINIVIS